MQPRFNVDVSQIMAKKRSKQRISLTLNVFVAVAIVFTLVTSGCSVLTAVILLLSVPVALLVSISIISWIFDIRTELLKHIHGSILDVGCADGPYLKYYNKPGVSKVVFLEPNAFHHPRLQRHIRTMQQQHPSTLGNADIVVEGRFIEELEISMGATYVPEKGRTIAPSAGSSSSRKDGSPGTGVVTSVTPSRLTRSAAKREQQCSDELTLNRGEDTSGGGENEGFDWIILGNVLCEVPDQEGVLFHVDRLLKPGGSVYFSEHIAQPSGTCGRYVQEWVNPWWCCVSDGCNVNRPTLDRLLERFSRAAGWEVQYWQMEVGALVPFVMGVATKPKSLGAGTVGVGVGSDMGPFSTSRKGRKVDY